MVADALGRGTVCGIDHARFRATIAPGARLSLDARPAGEGRARVALAREGAPVLDAVLVFGPPSAGGRTGATPDTPPLDAPPLDTLLPHRPPMRFVAAVHAMHEDGADCAASIPRDCALVRDGRAPALAVIEAAAQAAAVWEALRRRDGADAGAREGYLVALRDLVLHRADVPAGAPLAATVRLAALALPLTQYRAEVTLDGELVMRGTLGTVLA